MRRFTQIPGITAWRANSGRWYVRFDGEAAARLVSYREVLVLMWDCALVEQKKPQGVTW